MCLILFAWKSHPECDLILAANRDEFYERPTQPAHFWEENPNLLAGKDEIGGGTWIGMTKSGRWAALTNYRDPQNIDPKAPTRGQLTTDFLTSDLAPQDYLKALKKKNTPFNGYNLLVGDQNSLWYFNNVNNQTEALGPGIYGLSNGLLNVPWSKVEKGKADLSKLVEDNTFDVDTLLGILKNDQIANDDKLPQTGVPLAWERSLSPLFITTEKYGTRCSTVILKNQTNSHFVEKTYPLENQKAATVQFEL